MASEWRDVTWGDLATLEYGKALRGYEDKLGPVRVFGTNGPIGWHDEPLYDKASVVVGRKGAYRGIHFSPDPCFVIDTAFYLKPKKEYDVRWAYYELLTHDINSMDSGSAIPSTSRDAFYALPVRLPPLPEQKAIAHILGTLDDKIELNRRMNETLEGIARAIFKSWFVDFDPVRAKMDGRQPAGMDADTAKLFPDEFEESELGPIPKGWRVLPLPEAIEVNPARRLPKGTSAPYLDMKNMPTHGHRSVDWCQREFKSGTRFVQGDTLLARITPCLENGKTAFVDFLTDGEVGWGSTEYIVLRPKPPLPPPFAYYLARYDEFRSHAIQNMTGTSGRQRVPPSSLDQFLLAVPSSSVAARFGDIVSTVMSQVRANSEQTCCISALRDALLPRLLSGEIRVSEADKVAEEVT